MHDVFSKRTLRLATLPYSVAAVECTSRVHSPRLSLTRRFPLFSSNLSKQSLTNNLVKSLKLPTTEIIRENFTPLITRGTFPKIPPEFSKLKNAQIYRTTIISVSNDWVMFIFVLFGIIWVTTFDDFAFSIRLIHFQIIQTFKDRRCFNWSLAKKVTNFIFINQNIKKILCLYYLTYYFRTNFYSYYVKPFV